MRSIILPLAFISFAYAASLSKDYDHKVYSALGDIRNVSKLVSHDDIQAVGHIIRKYDYQKSVMAIIAHRHFDLQPNEGMLEMVKGDVVVVKPHKMEDIIPMEAHPNIIALGQDGNWYPVNYALGDEDYSAWRDEDFLSEVGTYLDENKLADKIMLGLRGKFNKFGAGSRTLERNHQRTRTSVIGLAPDDMEEDENTIRTSYTFHNDRDKREAQWCYHGCSGDDYY